MSEHTFHLDLTGCETWQELHQRIKDTFGFPDWYGCNWDAFYDLMCTEVAANKVIITGEHTLPAILQDELKTMHIILSRVQKVCFHELNEAFTYEVLN